MYCVQCDADHTPTNGLERCPESERGLSHLWAQVGHVEGWFTFKRPALVAHLDMYGEDNSIVALGVLPPGAATDSRFGIVGAGHTPGSLTFVKGTCYDPR